MKLLLSSHPINDVMQLGLTDIKFKDDQMVTELQLQCFMILRFLNSIEKNRKVFKFLFPPKVLVSFLDVPNYCKNLNAYKTLVYEFTRLS